MSEQLTIELPGSLAAALRAAIEAGAYASASEAVQDALQLWLARQSAERERLRAAWDDGKASGRHGALDFDELRREARKRLAAAKASGD